MRFMSKTLQCSPWLAAIWLATVAAAFAVLIVYTGRVEVASDNAAAQQLQAASNDTGPAGNQQTHWR